MKPPTQRSTSPLAIGSSPLSRLCEGPDSRRAAVPANKVLTSAVGVRQVGRLMISERLKGSSAWTSGKEVCRNRPGTRRGRLNDAHAAVPKSCAKGSEVRATHLGRSESQGDEIIPKSTQGDDDGIHQPVAIVQMFLFIFTAEAHSCGLLYWDNKSEKIFESSGELHCA